MSVGTFTILKNEARFIRAHILSWLSFVDQMSLFDGNSTDGTVEIIKEIRASHPFGKRIILVEGKDPKDLDADYQVVFNECLQALNTDYAIFAHIDMMLDEPGKIASLGDAVAYATRMRSFAGEPDGQLYEITGRADYWKNIFRLRNPDLGLHYFGAYGAANEDCYFSAITGNSHEHYGHMFDRYPYEVEDSGIVISHFSDVRSYERRLDRMTKCLINQGVESAKIAGIAEAHPRVTLKDGDGLTFKPVDYPAYLKEPAGV